MPTPSEVTRSAASTAQPKYVARIKPDSPRKIHGVDGVSYERELGWYKIASREHALRLKKVKLHGEDSHDETRVFDVMSATKAEAIEKARAKAARRPGKPFEPIDPALPRGAAPRTEAELDEDLDVDQEQDDELEEPEERPAPRRMRRGGVTEATAELDEDLDDERPVRERASSDGRLDDLLSRMQQLEQANREFRGALDRTQAELEGTRDVLTEKEAEIESLRTQLAQEKNPPSEREARADAPPPLPAQRPGAGGSTEDAPAPAAPPPPAPTAAQPAAASRPKASVPAANQRPGSSKPA